MKTATVRQLRHDFGSILELLEQGEQIRISKRGKIIAFLSPPPKPRKKGRTFPDFAGRLKRIYGEKSFDKNIVLEERESRSF